jgi:GNAT superfamily N-acetyltransferase
VAGSLRVRRMRREETGWMVDRMRDEGWNPGLDDALLFYDTDPDGFFVGEIDGRLAGCLAGVAYDDSYGFLGGYIVVSEERGKGYGIAMWNEAMAYLGERNVGLDGVVEQQDNYRRSGFELAYRQVRQEGMGAAHPASGIVPLSSLPFEQVLDYDTRHYPVRRESFLRRWLAQPGAEAAAALAGDGSLAGYGLIRRCRTGRKVGPLFADSPGVAERLLGALVSFAPGEPVFLDTPEANPKAVELARSFGMAPVFETARMYNRGDPGFALDEVYGVTTFELG